ncbi:MAG: NTPase [Promethearchaeota archaeon]|nr:MAG: NTPase [Candidatus Lokiarchaeota archaeon]
MDLKILITGPPRCGKSTLISKLIEYYHSKKYIIYGFLTPEIRDSGNRIGFNILDIYSGEESQLARIGIFKTKYRLGKYNVFIEEFDKYLENSLILEEKTPDIYIIDEIGKMELFSEIFQNFIKSIFSSKISIIATIGLKLEHPVKKYLINLPSIQLLNLNRQNSHLIFEKVISFIP